MKEGKDEVERGRGKRRLAGAIGQIGQFLRQLGQGGLQRLLNDLERWVREVLEGLKDKNEKNVKTLGTDLTTRHQEYANIRQQLVDEKNTENGLGLTNDADFIDTPTIAMGQTIKTKDKMPGFFEVSKGRKALQFKKKWMEAMDVLDKFKLGKFIVATIVELGQGDNFKNLVEELSKDVEKMFKDSLDKLLSSGSADEVKNFLKERIEKKLKDLYNRFNDEDN